VAGPELEVDVRPERGPGGGDLGEGVAGSDQKEPGAGGREGP
jgi:hypothetical protein